MKATNIPQCQKEFFTEHRHNVGPDGRTNEIVLVTQDLAQLCAFVRGLVEETYRAVKLTAIGQKNKYRVDVFMGAATGQKPGKPMRQLYGSYKPEIYQYYKSHTRNKTDFAAGMEEKADDRANVLKHPLIKFGIPLAVLIMVAGVWKAVAYFSPEEHTDELTPDTEQSTPGNNQQPVTATQSAQTAQQTRAVKASLEGRAPHQVKHEIEPGWLPLSNKWRIVGEVNNIYWIWGETGTGKSIPGTAQSSSRPGNRSASFKGSSSLTTATGSRRGQKRTNSPGLLICKQHSPRRKATARERERSDRHAPRSGLETSL